MAKRKQNNIGINIGVDPLAVVEARKGVMEILTSGAEQETLRAALSVFSGICSTNNASISNVHINMPTDD